MSEGSIAIIDINTDTAPKTWLLLMRALDKADYVALDLELSGLGKTSARGVEEQYEEMCEVVKTRAIVSLGVATFTQCQRNSACPSNSPERLRSEVKQTSEHSLKVNGSGLEQSNGKNGDSKGSEATCPTVEVQVFNVWLLCDCPYMIDPSSAKFLVSHGFNFNKQFSLGLPYMPPEARDEMYQLPKYSLDELVRRIVERRVPVVLHNGFLDLLHLYHTCLGPLPHALPTLLADLADLFVGGVYDTKAMAQFKFYEDATFLEYVFRKSQLWSGVRPDGSGNTECRLKLCCPNYSSIDGVAVERQDVAPPPPLPREQLLQVQMCSTYASHGYCHAYQCDKCHNVTLAIDQKMCLQQTNRSRCKRKRPREDEDNITEEPQDSHMNKDDQEGKGSLMGEFKTDIAAARERLGQKSQDTLTTPPAQDKAAPPAQNKAAPPEQDKATPPAAACAPSLATFVSHRSGVDAFMTGFTFTCYALRAQHAGSHGSTDLELSGLADTRNCLNSRRRGQHHLPLTIFKSKYAKNSSSFTRNRQRLLTSATENI